MQTQLALAVVVAAVAVALCAGVAVVGVAEAPVLVEELLLSVDDPSEEESDESDEELSSSLLDLSLSDCCGAGVAQFISWSCPVRNQVPSGLCVKLNVEVPLCELSVKLSLLIPHEVTSAGFGSAQAPFIARSVLKSYD